MPAPSSFRSLLSRLFLVGGLSLVIGSAEAALDEVVDPVINAVLKKQIEPEEGVQITQITPFNFERRLPGAEKLVIWVKLGASYWETNFSILGKVKGRWKSLATHTLGNVEPAFNKITPTGVIVLDAKVPGPNDPICCPSQKKSLFYQYAKGKIIETTHE